MRIEHSSAVLGRASPHVAAEGRWCGSEDAAAVEVVRGARAVAAMRGMLVELSDRTGQAGAMDALDMFLQAPSAREKQPYLLLIGLRGGVEAEDARANDVDGAVLIYEYKVAGRGARVFATDDLDGEHTVIAPEEIRAAVAQIACRKLVQMGAVVALISLEGGRDSGAVGTVAAKAGGTCRIATRRRSVPRYLALADTLEATLANLGNNTRRNLRRYRQRLERDCGAEFVAHVEMSSEEFLEVNRVSTHPLPDAIAAWRYRWLRQVAQPVFCGLRAADGRWLSLLGGRRRPGTMHIDWQMNVAGMPRASLCTAMRSFVLEHEIAQGTRRLMFVGGTPHPMRHSFVCVDAVDVIVERRSAGAWALRRLSRWIFPEKNFLGQVLRDKQLRWMPW